MMFTAKVLRFSLLLGLVWATPYPCITVQAQEVAETSTADENPEAAAYSAVTTENLQIPVAELELLVRPLELEELVVEAEAWQSVLKSKVAEISEAEIAIRRQNQVIASREEAASNLETAAQELAEAEAQLAAATQGSPEFEEATRRVENANESLRSAQMAMDELAATQEELREDDSLQGALAEAEQTGVLAAAREIVNEAREERESLEAGTPEYQQLTEKIEALETAIAGVETAQEQQQETTPDTPEYEAATQALTAARETLAQVSEETASVETNAQQVLNQARLERDELDPNSLAYVRATRNIRRLEAALEDEIAAQERVDQLTPESPNYATALATLERAQLDLAQATQAALSLPEVGRRIRSRLQTELEATEPDTPAQAELTARIEALTAALDSLETAEQAVRDAEEDSPELAAAVQAIADAESSLANLIEAETSELDKAKRTLYEARQAARETGELAEISQQKLSQLETAVAEFEQLQTRLAELEPDAPEVEQLTSDLEAAEAQLTTARQEAEDFSVLLVNAQRLLSVAREQQENADPEAPETQAIPPIIASLEASINAFQGLTEANEAARQSLQNAITQTVSTLNPVAAEPSEQTGASDVGSDVDVAAPEGPEGSGEEQEDSAAITEAATELQQQAEVEAELKNRLVETVTELQSQRTALTDRLEVVLNEMDRKGGESAPYRRYVSSVGQVVLDLEDTEGLGVRILSWLRSEEGGLRWGINIGKFVGIIIGFAILCQIFSAILSFLLSKFSNTSILLRQFLVALINRGGIVIGFLIALTALEVSLGPILALLGGASFVLAFALQSNLGNLASGLMIMVTKPFDLNDEVKVAGVWGVVDSITLASTRIKRWDRGEISTIPNNTVWGSTIVNLTPKDGIFKLVSSISVEPNADLDKVKNIIQEAMDASPLVLRDFWYGTLLWNIDDSANIFFAAMVKHENYFALQEELLLSIQRRLREEGISIIPNMYQVSLLPPGGAETNGQPSAGNGQQAASSRQVSAEQSTSQKSSGLRENFASGPNVPSMDPGL